MLSLREIELFLQRTPPHLQAIVWELRNLIVSVATDADGNVIGNIQP